MKRFIRPLGLTVLGAALLTVLVIWTKAPDFDLAAGLVPWVLPLAMLLLAAGCILLCVGVAWSLVAGFGALAQALRGPVGSWARRRRRPLAGPQ